MKRLTLVLAGTALLAAAACGPARSGSLGPAPTGGPTAATPSASTGASTDPTDPSPPSGSARPSTSATSTPPDRPGTGAEPRRTVTIQLWFPRDGKIHPTRRTRPATVGTSRLALTELVAGPSRAESAAGLGNGLASGTTFAIRGISGGVATVDFPASFYAGGRDAARLRQAQVVYTLTQFATVSKVGFQQAGAPAGWPVGRADYADLLPRIVVTSPVIGQRVSSPITVAGTAEVFEATVNLRVLDSDGAVIATRFTTATCGSGCRGEYSVTVPYRLGTDQPGTVQVYAISMRDGSFVHLVSIPVRLAAAHG